MTYCTGWRFFFRNPSLAAKASFQLSLLQPLMRSAAFCALRGCESLITVSFSYLHYKIIQHVCEAISSNFVSFARNCLASSLDYIVMQIRTANHGEGYYNWHWRLKIVLTWGLSENLYFPLFSIDAFTWIYVSRREKASSTAFCTYMYLKFKVFKV